MILTSDEIWVGLPATHRLATRLAVPVRKEPGVVKIDPVSYSEPAWPELSAEERSLNRARHRAAFVTGASFLPPTAEESTGEIRRLRGRLEDAIDAAVGAGVPWADVAALLGLPVGVARAAYG
jgi:hypothetical protein